MVGYRILSNALHLENGCRDIVFLLRIKMLYLVIYINVIFLYVAKNISITDVPLFVLK